VHQGRAAILSTAIIPDGKLASYFGHLNKEAREPSQAVSVQIELRRFSSHFSLRL
jgi:hypothetical protein